MKKSTLCIGLLVAAHAAAFAQFTVQPQAGITLQTLNQRPVESTTKAKVGYLVGLDARLGKQLYFQPGLFFNHFSTELNRQGDRNQIRQSILRVKALAGYNLIHSEDFKFRINAGPSYDFLVHANDAGDVFRKSSYRKGWLNAGAGLGIDISRFTLDVGTSWGLTRTFDRDDIDSKFFNASATVGIRL
ncbi:MAG: outer membrane beta-barrel protein [Cytophagales bacterium]|nr:outer membrane beta-barrel protein [Cytophagales bacterium]